MTFFLRCLGGGCICLFIPVDGRLRCRLDASQTESRQSPLHHINADAETLGHDLSRDTVLEPFFQQDVLAC